MSAYGPGTLTDCGRMPGNFTSIKERRVKTSYTFYAVLLCAMVALLHHTPAEAAWCTLPDGENDPPIISVNPKPFTVPPPSTCLLTYSDLSDYTLIATRSANITASGVVVGTLYDYVWCKGEDEVCDSSDTYILGTRVRMAETPINFPLRNPNCPVWSGTSNECFEINNIFRNILGDEETPVTAQVGYIMGGSGTTDDTDPFDAVAVKYLEYTGKTYKGLNQVTPPGSASDRDNTKVMFWADTNVFDPDGENSQWSPWLLVKQNCPNGFDLGSFAVKFWQGGEESQIPTNIQASAYICE